MYRKDRRPTVLEAYPDRLSLGKHALIYFLEQIFQVSESTALLSLLHAFRNKNTTEAGDFSTFEVQLRLSCVALRAEVHYLCIVFLLYLQMGREQQMANSFGINLKIADHRNRSADLRDVRNCTQKK